MRISGCGLLVVAAGAASGPSFAQCSLEKHFSSDFAQGAKFGHALAVEGSTLVVGSPRLKYGGVPHGAAYVFESSGGSWRETQRLDIPTLSLGADAGTSVAISGDWIAVGAPDDYEGSLLGSGSVLVYQRQPGGWSAPIRIKAAVPVQNGRFGVSVALSADWLLVGAPPEGLPSGAGAVYAFHRQGSTWTQTARIMASDPEFGAQFGRSIAIDGTRALVGAPTKDEPYPGGMQFNTGAAYVFELGPPGWQEVAKIVPPVAFQQNAGWAVALEGQRAILGAILYTVTSPNHHTAGACYAYRETPGGWVLAQRINAGDPSNGALFGYSLALSGNRFLVGSATDNDLDFGAGSAYVFEHDGISWNQMGKLLAGDGRFGDKFGTAVALHGDSAMVGAPTTDDACPSSGNCDSGAFYTFRTVTNATQMCHCLRVVSVCGNADEFGGCRNSTGHGAVLSACGTASVAADDIALEARWLPPSSFALLFMGGAPGSITPFGDGRLCVLPGTAGIHRYPLATTSATGSLAYAGLGALAQSFPPAGHIQPGDTWHFQVWYRDATGPCGSSINLSNALRVTFQP